MADYNYENREKYEVSILLLLLLLFIIFDNNYDAIIMQSEGIKQLRKKKFELKCFNLAMQEAEDLKKMRVENGIILLKER